MQYEVPFTSLSYNIYFRSFHLSGEQKRKENPLETHLYKFDNMYLSILYFNIYFYYIFSEDKRFSKNIYKYKLFTRDFFTILLLEEVPDDTFINKVEISLDGHWPLRLQSFFYFTSISCLCPSNRWPRKFTVCILVGVLACSVLDMMSVFLYQYSLPRFLILINCLEVY